MIGSGVRRSKLLLPGALLGRPAARRGDPRTSPADADPGLAVTPTRRIWLRPLRSQPQPRVEPAPSGQHVERPCGGGLGEHPVGGDQADPGTAVEQVVDVEGALVA